MTTYLEHVDGRVSVEECPLGRRRITFEPRNPGRYVPYREYETAYPLALIEKVLEATGAVWLCDEIRRDEDPAYVQRGLELTIASRIPLSDLEHKRLLDFGCGSGASTLSLARIAPLLDVVGVELDPVNVAIAEARAEFYGLPNVSFHISPSSESLPASIGEFDFVLLSAVWEHLLANERGRLATQLWALLRPGGVLFLNQTPYRWSLIESHTTGLPLLNYLPAQLACWAARRFSKTVSGDEPWETLLRKGIRGGSEGEVMSALRKAARETGSPEPSSLEPSLLGMNDRVDPWYELSQRSRPSRIKQVMRALFRIVRRATGRTITPSIDLAIRKRDESQKITLQKQDEKSSSTEV